MARGSVSPFEIVLTADERQELERWARAYTDPYWRVVRAKIVLLAARGLGERGDRSPAGYQPAGGSPVAQAVLRGAA